MSLSIRAVQALALCGALLLSACAGPSKQDMYGGERPQQTTPQVEVQKKAETPRLSARRLAAIKEYGLEKAQPDKLVGLDGFEVEQALGTADFIRKDSGVEIWQYRANHCILDLFLYQNGAHLRVDHTELRGSLPKEKAAADCFNQIVMDLRP
ncbi:hypothetical protein GCM10011332_10300 [Terasakiella brassicae]|uniref:Lipoprotein n=1 Tax=Terasakiella brassicae TaxID=1634917 RepID=A0A917F8W8_9PROT|nr:hypothetical protein [Terasakiella brassicae]GGF58669.1 hypothetical protein GCM10011332_10300 [Terasakiella brassicae]